MIKLIALVMHLSAAFGWKYETKCTRQLSAFNHNMDTEYNSIMEDFERDLFYENELANHHINKLRLKCANVNDFLFIGQTKYGVSSSSSLSGDTCSPSESDCAVTVDYIANQCNGLNSCHILLDAQFLHLCKNNSDYISVAYECIPGSQKVDICSNDETFIIDSSLAAHTTSNSLSRFASFYLTSPDYPLEYKNNLNNCTCKLDYVTIDSSADSSATAQISLALTAYEFDLEESDKCHKDHLAIRSDTVSTLCGQHSHFKQVYAAGSKLSLQFSTDDAITRRGFLIKVSTQSHSQCPFGSTRFSADKCVKLFGDNQQRALSYKLDWFEAAKACASLNGRLFTAKDFADDLSIESLLSDAHAYWSRRHNESKCLSKTTSAWIEESCVEKRAFVCEFDPVAARQTDRLVSGVSDQSGNRLIRVACGSAATIFSSSFRSESSTTDTVKSNSITNTQRPSTRTTTATTKASTVKSIITVQENEERGSTYQTALKNDATLAIFSQDVALIVAIACGVSLVLIAINIFCLWNCLSKKLRKYDESQTYVSRSNKSTNRTLASSVDSYGKVAPFDLEHMSACESLSSSGSELAYGTHKPAHHYYETLSKQHSQWNNYAEYHAMGRVPPFDSMVVMPCRTMNAHYMPTVRPVPINPTVVLLKQLPQQQQQPPKTSEHEQYSCVVYGELSPASSNASNQPLITFSSSSSGVSA